MRSASIDPRQARALQIELAGQISRQPVLSLRNLKFIGGADVSYETRARDGYAAIVVCTYPNLDVVEIASARGTIEFPYIPGLLSFREIPLLREAWFRLRQKPEILICDGQGIAHPRRIGLASHLGLELGVCTVGCGKSRLIGDYRVPGLDRGDRSDLTDEGETIGKVLRTRTGVKPLFISIGHQVSLDQSVRLILNLCKGYRQPEPIRLAHREVNRLRRAARSA
jgi:deoxyribonuclease V